jgi:hypothetical protein
LDKADNKLFIITSKIVEARAYNAVYRDTTWEQCTLRKYLNGEFYNKFSETEKAIVADTKVVNADNPSYDTNGGNDTTDKIFLLSIDEVKKYFKDDNDRALGSWWWLRSPGYTSRYAASVYYGGLVDVNGDIVDYGGGGVRPALWLNL